MLAAPLSSSASQSVTLKWNPSADTNVAGYRIYYSTVSHSYTNIINVGNVTSTVISNLADATAYYFAAKTTDASGNQSDFSNEAAFTTDAAVVTPVNPITPVIPTNPVVPVVINQFPTLNSLTNLSIYQTAGTQTVTLAGITSGSPTEKQVLQVTVTASNTNIITKPILKYVSPNTNGTLVFSPSTKLTGTSIITVTVNDGGLSNNIIAKQFTVTVIAPPNLNLPKFSKPLTNTVALVGQTVTFSTTVSGKAPFKYQWKFNGNNLSGATGATLTLRNVKVNQAGAYTVSVSNSAGSTNGVVNLAVFTSKSAMLAMQTVTINPLTTAATLTSAKQANGQFTFTVSGVAGLKYVVQASSDLKNWDSIQTNMAPFTLTDSNASSFSKRFYRTYYLP